jgi:hypothetical protein
LDLAYVAEDLERRGVYKNGKKPASETKGQAKKKKAKA